MVVEGDAPAAATPVRDFSRRLALGATLGAAHGAVVGTLFVVPGLAHTGLFGLAGGQGFSMVVLLPLVALIAVGAWLGRRAANLGARHVLERDRLRDVERFDATPRRPIREIVEGPVRVRGFIRAVVPTRNDHGMFCVACEALPDGGDAATPRQARGGVFELVDGDGDSTWVDARHVAVVDGMEFDGERMVPPGVVVELWATAVRDAEAPEQVRGYREAATAWVLQGTATWPVVLRVV